MKEIYKDYQKDLEKMFRNRFIEDSLRVSEIFLQRNYYLISLHII